MRKKTEMSFPEELRSSIRSEKYSKWPASAESSNPPPEFGLLEAYGKVCYRISAHHGSIQGRFWRLCCQPNGLDRRALVEPCQA